MQTIIVLLNPGELENPDMDLCYCVPDRIEEVSDSVIQSNGYDFIDTEEGQPGPLMGIWLQTENAGESWPVISLLCLGLAGGIPLRLTDVVLRSTLRSAVP